MLLKETISLLAILVVNFFFSTALEAESRGTDIRVNNLSESTYEITLESSTIADIQVGQLELIPTANKLCAGKHVRFGQYEFELLEKLETDNNNKSEPQKLR